MATRRRSPPASFNPDFAGNNCPVRRTLRLVADKWTPIILYCLSEGVWRFSDLQRNIPKISKKVLVQALRDLERSGLVERKLYPTVPPKTEYRLTENGHRVHEPMRALCEWAERNTDLLNSIESGREAHKKK